MTVSKQGRVLNVDALIHDLAIVVRSASHPSAQIGPAGRLAVRRMQVLGWADGEVTGGVEDRLIAALAGRDPRRTAGVAREEQGR